MPQRAPQVLAEVPHKLRHVGPKAVVWPNGPEATYKVLARTDMVARPLPSSEAPSSPDFVQGTWTGRLGDAGELTAQFPNAQASDGVPWRQRFDPTGHLQWVEIWAGGELDQVGVIDNAGPDYQQVQLHAYTGDWLLKKAYERDLTVTWAPRDAIMRGCSLWTPVTVDEFQGASLSPTWTINTGASSPAGSIVQRSSGGMKLALPANQTGSGISSVTATGPSVTLPGATGTWMAFATVSSNNLAGGSGEAARLRLQVTEASGDTYAVTVAYTSVGVTGTLVSSRLSSNQISSIPSASQYSLQLESDGTWVWAFVTGQLIAVIHRPSGGSATTTSLQAQLALLIGQGFSNPEVDATVGEVLVRAQVPFLQSAADPGDYVLPGNASTYPWGGLHARYCNDADLSNDSDRLLKILNPSRMQAYGSSSSAEYLDQQDSTISAQSNSSVGASNTNWSCVWFGSIWLQWASTTPSAGGSYIFQIKTPSNGMAQGNEAIRFWIGNLQCGAELLAQFDAWRYNQTYQITVTAAQLAGSLPYGAGSVARTGWYPIKIEYAVDGIVAVAPTLQFASTPVAYTDPGGTMIAAGAQATVIPQTSLSPLGCVDQRYQAVAHFDMVQQTAQAFGHQYAIEPKQLESGLFPGVLAPRVREGHDTDVVLEPDRSPRQDGEGILNYSSALDTTDYASEIMGNGAGFQSGGDQGQLQGIVFDQATMLAALFAVQGWQDFSDASYGELLTALLDSALFLRDSPWQVVQADPFGRPRLSYSWPLPGSLIAMRWRPGDGLFVHAQDINIWDTLPRQLLVMQRTFVSEGYTATTATFANRPRGAAYQIAQELRKIRRWQRNYQRQLVTLSSKAIVQQTIAAGATDSDAAEITLLPHDRLKGLTLRVTDLSSNGSFGLQINGTDVTTGHGLFGPWGIAPININILPAWGQASGGQSHIRAKLINKLGTGSITVDYQIFADVIR